VKNQVSEPGDPPGFLQKIDFDIELKNADGLWVDNNLAKFRTNHDLRLHGTFDEAVLTGRIDVRDRGELIFLDRRFEILNGVIDCSDPRRLNPVINLTATCDITESSSGSARPTRYTITLTVSGPLDEFDYALTSKPALEQADIFSLLALGMTQYQLEAGGNKDAVYKDRSEVLASQQISNSVNRFFDNMLGDMLALDHIGIGGNLFDPNQTRFEVTKRWSDRVEVKYSTSITNVDEQILSVEYKINDFLYLEGKSDQMEDSGADLKFRVWFK
jgi:translocation and assembly module TamB